VPRRASITTQTDGEFIMRRTMLRPRAAPGNLTRRAAAGERGA
jgi:hypothetical protein